VFVFQGVSATDSVTGVTYGGTALTAVASGTATDTATEPGRVKAYFLGSGVPTTDNPTVVVSRTSNTTTMWAVCVTVTAATDTEVFNKVLLQENGVFAEQAVTDGSPGVNSVRYAGAYYGGATPAPAGANSTLLHSNDAGAYGWSAVRETTAGQGSRLVGFTQATADDRAGVHLAIRELQPPSLPGFLDTTWVEPESHCLVKPIINGNGDRYRVAESNLARGNHPLMGKSTDGGMTWAEVDAAGSDARTTQDLEGVWVLKDGTSFIMLTTRDSVVYLDEFRMSDHATNPDTWGFGETVDTGLSTSGVIQATSIVKLSNGNYQCFYSDLLNGTNNQIALRRRTGTNTYTTKQTFNDGALNVTAPKAVVGENDVTYVFYKDNTSDSLVYRTVSATGTISARTTVASGTSIASDTIAHTNPVYYDDGGVEVIGIAYINDSDILKYRELRDGVLQTEETISTAALTTNPGATDSQAAVACLAVDQTTVYAMWSRLSDGDLMKRVRTLGSGWGSEATQWASGGGTGWYIYSDVVTEGTDVKLIYTYDWGTHVDDASNITYNEEVLRTTGGGTVFVEASRSTTWNTKAAVSASRGTTWNTKAAVSASRDTTWHTRAAVTASRDTTWHTRAAITSSRATSWHTLAAVTASRDTTWHTRVAVTASRDTTWHTLAQVMASRNTTWNVDGALVFVSASRDTTWHTLASVEASRSTTWHVAQSVVSSRSSTWHTLASVVASRGSSWHTLARVSAARETTWHTLASVSALRSTTWNVLQQVSASRNTTWNVDGSLVFVSSSRDTTWNLLANVVGSRQTSWHTLAGVVASRSTTWHDLASVQASRDTTWNIRAQVLASRATSWNVLATVLASREAIWHTLAGVEASRSSMWNVLSDIEGLMWGAFVGGVEHEGVVMVQNVLGVWVPAFEQVKWNGSAWVPL
jgi:hypothetical protein